MANMTELLISSDGHAKVSHEAVKEYLAVRRHRIDTVDPKSEGRVDLINVPRGYRVPKGIQGMAMPVWCPKRRE